MAVEDCNVLKTLNKPNKLWTKLTMERERGEAGSKKQKKKQPISDNQFDTKGKTNIVQE